MYFIYIYIYKIHNIIYHKKPRDMKKTLKYTYNITYISNTFRLHNFIYRTQQPRWPNDNGLHPSCVVHSEKKIKKFQFTSN